MMWRSTSKEGKCSLVINKSSDNNSFEAKTYTRTFVDSDFENAVNVLMNVNGSSCACKMIVKNEMLVVRTAQRLILGGSGVLKYYYYGFEIKRQDYEQDMEYGLFNEFLFERIIDVFDENEVIVDTNSIFGFKTQLTISPAIKSISFPTIGYTYKFDDINLRDEIYELTEEVRMYSSSQNTAVISKEGGFRGSLHVLNQTNKYKVIMEKRENGLIFIINSFATLTRNWFKKYVERNEFIISYLGTDFVRGGCQNTSNFLPEFLELYNQITFVEGETYHCVSRYSVLSDDESNTCINILFKSNEQSVYGVVVNESRTKNVTFRTDIKNFKTLAKEDNEALLRMKNLLMSFKTQQLYEEMTSLNTKVYTAPKVILIFSEVLNYLKNVKEIKEEK